MKRSRGFTLSEILVASAFSLVVLGSVGMTVTASSRQAQKPLAAMRLEEEAHPLVRTLHQDLQETSPLSVRIFPDGLSLESPRDHDGQLHLGEYGAVRWQKYVYYTVRPVSEEIGELTRVEGSLEKGQPTPWDTGRRIPVPSVLLPSEVSSPTRRVLSRSVVIPRGFQLTAQGELIAVDVTLRSGTSTYRLPFQVQPANF